MSLPSPIDRVTVEAAGVGKDDFFSFEDWTSFDIKSSLIEPSEASFEVGDETGFDRMSQLAGLGARFRVFVNDRPRLTGRVELLESTVGSSTTQRFVVRTRLSDAAYATAPHGLRLKGVSIKRFVLACYEAIGLTEADFDFRGDVSRDLMTGKRSSGGRVPPDLEPLKEDQAKVQPPESVFEAVDRHLRRHGFLHWDAPDGKIIVARPDDQQDPIANLWLYRDAQDAQLNNLLSIQRAQDVSASPTALGMFGIDGKADFSKAKVAALRQNDDLIKRGFRRNVVIIDESIRTKSIAERRASRELANRNRGLDHLVAVLDGLAYREGAESYPWTVDTTADVVASHLGGAIGQYYIEEVGLSLSASEGARSTLGLVAQGVWTL